LIGIQSTKHRWARKAITPLLPAEVNGFRKESKLLSFSDNIILLPSSVVNKNRTGIIGL